MSEHGNERHKRLARSTKNRMVAGVAGGVAEYLDVDPNLVRLGFAALTIFVGAGVLLYLVAWVILPEESEDTSIAEQWVNSRRSKS
ncbi:MAG TPA: PspC domain-containing protein [Streptosporangiaceae bacterium]|nr:PspC domain-containing protein [Streptosporangiaceae bacterium]